MMAAPEKISRRGAEAQRPAAIVTSKTRGKIDAQEQAKVREARRAWSPKSLMLPFQRKLADDPARYVIAAWSRQTGKSFSTGEIAAEGAITDPGGSWTCLSAGERQALEWLEKTKDWAQAFKLSIASATEERSANIAEALLKSAEIRFATGGVVRAIPANPSTARGYSTNVILDEFGYHEDPDKIWRAMFPSSANPLAGTFLERVAAHLKGGDASAVRRRDLRVIVVSTFNGRGNKFFDLWEKRQANGWSGHLVTIEDAVRQGLPVDIEKLRQALDDPDGWAQEFMCEPMDSSNVLLPYDLIATAESADATEACDIAALPARGNPIYCGIDFGRQSDPTVCWTCELVGGVLWTREVLVLRGTDTPDQQAILESRIQAATRVIQSLEEHATFLTQKIQFLLDATLGLVNLEQNNIIKLFSVMAVIFMPPTLIASIYGMNFKYMPELETEWGYPIALLAMVAAAVLPYAFFRWKKWL